MWHSWGREEMHIKVAKHEGKRSLQKPRHRWRILKWGVIIWIRLNWLSIGSS
jgi:hypothetical protein